MSKREQISIRLSVDLLEKIERLADFNGVTRSSIIQVALTQYMNDIENNSVLFKNLKGEK